MIIFPCTCNYAIDKNFRLINFYYSIINDKTGNAERNSPITIMSDKTLQINLELCNNSIQFEFFFRYSAIAAHSRNGK